MMILVPRWLAVRIRARRICCSDDDLEQIAYITATIVLKRRKEQALMIKLRRACREMRRACREMGVNLDPDRQWMLMSEREKREVLERMDR